MTTTRKDRNTMDSRVSPTSRRWGRGQEGQIIVIAPVLFILLIAMVALILDGGNAYAQQRVTQNGTDAAANAGAAVLAVDLAGTAKTDAQVLTAVDGMATANELSGQPAVYTNSKGQPLNADDSVWSATDGLPWYQSATPPTGIVGKVESIPAHARGVAVRGSRDFPTYFGRALGIDSFTAGAEATAITGPLTGGFLPIVIPTSIVDCTKSGDLGTPREAWVFDGGPKYIVPLCKTGTGSFMILDLDGDNKTTCTDEVENPPLIVWPGFPFPVDTNVGNDCVKKMEEYINTKLTGTVVGLPICAVDCTTTGGSKAQYTIMGVAGFLVDYISYTNNPNNELCKATPGNGLVNMIAGNASDSCIVGRFVSWVTVGPVGTGDPIPGDAIGVQLIH